jgi:hypothetical protein
MFNVRENAVRDGIGRGGEIGALTGRSSVRRGGVDQHCCQLKWKKELTLPEE